MQRNSLSPCPWDDKAIATQGLLRLPSQAPRREHPPSSIRTAGFFCLWRPRPCIPARGGSDMCLRCGPQTYFPVVSLQAPRFNQNAPPQRPLSHHPLSVSRFTCTPPTKKDQPPPFWDPTTPPHPFLVQTAVTGSAIVCSHMQGRQCQLGGMGVECGAQGEIHPGG